MTPVSAQYTAFGEMAVVVDGVRKPLTRARERGVLAVLLAAHGTPVAAERILTEVWGDESPSQTVAALQVAVSRLRRLLEPDRAARAGSRLVSTSSGYALVATVEDVDTWQLRRTRAERALAEDDPARRLALCEEALVAAAPAPRTPTATRPSSRSETSRLDELDLTVRGAPLPRPARPGPARRGPPITRRPCAPAAPTASGLWSLLARAQYQCARQADALETLRLLRERLAEELGVDPSQEMRDLEQAVLRQDAALLSPVAEAAAPDRHRCRLPVPSQADRDRRT